jgi:hypothetical protein
MTEPTPHVPFDFENMPQTNEQKILASSLRIEGLLVKLVDASSWTDRTPKHLEAAAAARETPEVRKGKIEALMAKTGTRRK